MQNKLKKTVLTLAVGSAVALTSGCALSPQLITLQTDSPLKVATENLGRTALVRVRDLRDDTDRLGSRGGSQPEQALLLSKPNLKDALTVKMQSTLQQLGFGGASPQDPVKVDLAVEEFNYQCNKGSWVNQCDLSIRFNLTVINDGNTFAQPFTITQQRSVATAPRAGYNEEWVNGALDELWSHMMTQPKVSQALGVAN
jgi:uncharacterized lipoprotein